MRTSRGRHSLQRGRDRKPELPRLRRMRVDIVDTGERLYSFTHQARIRSVSFSADSAKLITTGADGVAGIWCVASGDQAGAWLQHFDSIRSGAFNSDGSVDTTGFTAPSISFSPGDGAAAMTVNVNLTNAGNGLTHSAGSSSAVMVGLLHALYAFQGRFRSPTQLADEACRLEIEELKKPIGRQDQYAVANGGFNLIEFVKGGGVRTEPIVSPRGTLEKLHRSLMLFFSGVQRNADDVLEDQRQRIREGSTTEALAAMRDLAYEFRSVLAEGEVDAIGELLRLPRTHAWSSRSRSKARLGKPVNSSCMAS